MEISQSTKLDLSSACGMAGKAEQMLLRNFSKNYLKKILRALSYTFYHFGLRLASHKQIKPQLFVSKISEVASKQTLNKSVVSFITQNLYFIFVWADLNHSHVSETIFKN